MGTVLLFVVLGYFGWSLGRDALEVVTGRDRDTTRTLRAWRPWMIPGAVGILTAVIAAAVPLMTAYPWLRWSPWRLLGIVGNPYVGQTDHGGPLPAPVALILPVLLLVALPRLARSEENTFRRGAERRTPAGHARSALAFGLAHCLLVPLGAGLALSLAGLGFEAAYLRAYRREVRRLDTLPDRPMLAVLARSLLDPRRPGALVMLDELDRCQDAAVDTATALHLTYNVIILGALITVIAGAL